MRFRGSSIVGHKAHFNRDEGQERLVKVNTANGHKMKYRLHFGLNAKMWGMQKALTEQTPSTFPTVQANLIYQNFSEKCSLFLSLQILFK